MINNLGNNGEALKVFRTESVWIKDVDPLNLYPFILGDYIKSVQHNFEGKPVTKVHLKGIRETLGNTPIGIYNLSGFPIIGGELMAPPFPVLETSQTFVLMNFEEIEFYGNTNFNGATFLPINNGATVYSSGYLLQPPTSPPVLPSVNNFRLQITLMGL